MLPDNFHVYQHGNTEQRVQAGSSTPVTLPFHGYEES